MINWQKFFVKLKTVLIFQAVATLASLPFLSVWGMSVSRMTIIGNLVFSPFLSIFLFLSSLIFISELLSIPNYFLCRLLEKITDLCTWLLSFGQKSWLIPIPARGLLPLIISISIIFWLLTRQKKNQFFDASDALIICSIILLLIPSSVTRVLAFSEQSFEAKGSRGKISFVKKPNGQLKIIDDGFFGTCSNPEKSILFTLRPYLAKHYGTFQIDELELRRTTARPLMAASSLCTICKVETIKFHKTKKLFLKPDSTTANLHKAYNQLICDTKTNGTAVVETDTRCTPSPDLQVNL